MITSIANDNTCVVAVIRIIHCSGILYIAAYRLVLYITG